MVGYAAGSIAQRASLLARVADPAQGARERCSRGSMYLPGYGLSPSRTRCRSRSPARSSRRSARARRSCCSTRRRRRRCPTRVLGRVLGVISLTHRGAHATGLLLVSPLFAFVGARAVFGAAAIAVPLVGLVALAVATLAHSSSSLSSSTRDASKPSIRSSAPGSRGGRTGGHQPDELGADAPRAPRASASASIRATISCSAAASQSSTFIDTCTRPARGRSSPSARTPGKPPPRSRTTARDLRAPRRASPRRLTLNAISGRRAPRITPPAVSCSARRPEVGRELAGVEARLQARRRRRAGRTPARARAARRRRPAARAPSPIRAPDRLPPPRARAVRSSGRIGTIGTTSAAPIRGCAPSCARRSMRSTATRDARRRARRRARPPSPTSVKTERLWSASACTSSRRACAASAAPIASIVARVAALAEVRHATRAAARAVL